MFPNISQTAFLDTFHLLVPIPCPLLFNGLFRAVLYPFDFMDTMPSVLSKLCSAAKCEGEPWLDPDTGEEMDCDSFGGTEGLKFLVKRQMQEITPILKEKFGDDVVIKKFEKSKGWLSQKLSSSNNQVDQLANILDERSIWQRYGF